MGENEIRALGGALEGPGGRGLDWIKRAEGAIPCYSEGNHKVRLRMDELEIMAASNLCEKGGA